MKKYRVFYPLLTTDGHRDFNTREEAEKFFRHLNDNSRFQTIHSWRLFRIEEIEG